MFVNGRSFVAVSGENNTFSWQPVEIGLMSELYAEAKSGLSPGQQIAMAPTKLKIPLPDPANYPKPEPKPDDLPQVTVVAPLEMPEEEPKAAEPEQQKPADEPKPPAQPNPDDN